MIDALDPKGLIAEAYRIEAIKESECRSILLDWALSLPDGLNARDALPQIIAHYAQQPTDHPMSIVLAQGLAPAEPPRRRGGWRARPRD